MMRGKCPLRWLNDLNEHSIASMRQHVGQWKSQIYHSGDDVASFFQVELFSPRRTITQSVVIPSTLVSFALLIMVEGLDDDVEGRRQSGEAAQDYRTVFFRWSVASNLIVLQYY
ncbi:hypothetical protein PC128_g21550 [Phytophthora cactorum]|nr:hypothetical protein PC128_g21550 [Phytophthora cactorum]